MKLRKLNIRKIEWLEAAAVGWLSVETYAFLLWLQYDNAAAFGWLSVETLHLARLTLINYAAAFGWLSVETRLRQGFWVWVVGQPPSGG